MPTTTSQLPKAQPWKAHWSPVNNGSGTAGEKYLAGESGFLLIDGFHQCASADLFSELVCARKEPEQAKTQPWKAHWSPANITHEVPSEKYLVDVSGNLLVDGFHQCAGVDLFSELVCASKEPEQAKTQPWKTHWTPVNSDHEIKGEKYLVDESGTLLIDGFHQCASADLFSELVCARNG